MDDVFRPEADATQPVGFHSEISSRSRARDAGHVQRTAGGAKASGVSAGHDVHHDVCDLGGFGVLTADVELVQSAWLAEGNDVAVCPGANDADDDYVWARNDGLEGNRIRYEEVFDQLFCREADRGVHRLA